MSDNRFDELLNQAIQRLKGVPDLPNECMTRYCADVLPQGAGGRLNNEDVEPVLAEAARLNPLFKTRVDEFRQWACAPKLLNRVTASKAHSLQHALRHLGIFGFDDDHDFGAPLDFSTETWMHKTFLMNATDLAVGHSFLVQHDWGSLMRDAEGYKGYNGDTRGPPLPFNTCCFEFLVSDRHVCVVAGTKADGTIKFEAFADAKINLIDSAHQKDTPAWVVVNFHNNTIFKSFCLRLAEIICAICICLDAKVVETDIVRAPYRLNRARERAGKLPLYDYHIIKVNRERRRLPPLAEDEKDKTPGTPKRLHFRMGHWRHFENHKTWINWMLVGNPDLGFVDKEYRL